MSEERYDLKYYIENPPSIFDIFRVHSKTQYTNLQRYLKILYDQILPLFVNISDSLDQARNQMEDSQKMEKNKQILVELQELEKEHLWAQLIELEAQKRAITDLTQKLIGEISANSEKEGEIDSSLSSTRSQFQQKNDTVQTEFKKFRTINTELQQLFKDQNQILRKINQIETQLNNPKVKKTPDEISTLEKELEILHSNEHETRQKFPQKQKELESQRLLQQLKEKEFHPLKVKFDGMIAAQTKLKQFITGDKARLEEKQIELSEISKKIQEFLIVNKIEPKNKPLTIRTKNFIEDKIKSVKANIRPDSQVPSNEKTLLTENNVLLPAFDKLSEILDTLQSDQIQNEIRALSKEIVSLRNQFTPKFSPLMNAIGRKGGVQVRSLVTGKGTLRFIENGKENSIASLLVFLLAVHGRKNSQIKIDSHRLSPAQIEDLEGIINNIQSKTDSEIKITEV